LPNNCSFRLHSDLRSMRKFKIGIGIKVGSSALVGLVLVAGMVWNQARVNHLTQDLISQGALSRNLQQAALEAKVRLNELISIDRDLRLAKTSSEVNVILQHLKSRAADANSAYDSATALAKQDEDRQFLTKAKEAFNSYIATAEEIAGVQYEIIALRDRQLAENLAWATKFDTLINGPELASASNRHALESNLQQANSEFMRAGSISWSRFVRSDGTQMSGIFGALGTATLLLDESHSMMRNPDAKATISDLAKFPARYKLLVDGLTSAVQRQTDLLLQRAAPSRDQASDMMGLVAIGADQRSDSLADLTVTELSRSEWINFIVGALVILVMFSIAIVSTLTIGRPIRRIAQVLMQLAGGRNEVEIPYQGRQDEVGDAARAAGVFRDNIVRMQELETEQKRTVAEAARTRREQK
jgi:HAMP domain-containing protein